MYFLELEAAPRKSQVRDIDRFSRLANPLKSWPLKVLAHPDLPKTLASLRRRTLQVFNDWVSAALSRLLENESTRSSKSLVEKAMPLLMSPSH